MIQTSMTGWAGSLKESSMNEVVLSYAIIDWVTVETLALHRYRILHRSGCSGFL